MEGIIKFQCDWTRKETLNLPAEQLEVINRWRSTLMDKGLIGALENNVGYGNISVSFDTDKQFIITGSQTGHLPLLSSKHLALITDYDIEKNYIKCVGGTKASSESLSHAVFYNTDSSIGAVIHIHSETMWEEMKNKFPTTDYQAQYGTVDLALSIMDKLKNPERYATDVIVMGGHKDGILISGYTLEEVGEKVLCLAKKIPHPLK